MDSFSMSTVMRTRRCLYVIGPLLVLGSSCLVAAGAFPIDFPGPGNKQAAVAAPNPQASVRPRYELRLLPFETTWATIRFNVETGEAVLCRSGGTGRHFEKLPEQGRIPVGDYDIKMAPLAPNGWHGFSTVRIERNTGRTWALIDAKWEAIPEPDERGHTILGPSGGQGVGIGPH